MAYYNELPEEAQVLFLAGNASTSNEAPNTIVNNPKTLVTICWFAQQGLWSFSAQSPYEYFELAILSGKAVD